MLRMKKWTIKNISALDEFCRFEREEITIVFSTVLNKTQLKQQIFISLFCAQNFWQICTIPQQFSVQNQKISWHDSLAPTQQSIFFKYHVKLFNFLTFFVNLPNGNNKSIILSSHCLSELSINSAQRIDFLRADRLQTW